MKRFAKSPPTASGGPLLNPARSPGRSRGAFGFTLVELLVVITIIAILAGIAMGGLAKTREGAKLAATKATVAKLDGLVMRRYEYYVTRRVPLVLVTSATTGPIALAQTRRNAIRDLMRMEMPCCWSDVTAAPLSGVQSPSLQRIYQAKLNQAIANSKLSPPPLPLDPTSNDHQWAKCLYMWVMTACPEAKSMFRAEEIADVDHDGWKCFVDGWGHPIYFLRWAPGATAWSDIQVDDTGGNNFHHDPYDPMNTEKNAYHLYPLIFAGVLGKVGGIDDYGINLVSAAPGLDPYNGTPYTGVGAATGTGGPPLVNNHHMDAK